MNCNELVELVTDYLDGALTSVDAARFEHHISGCAGCTNYVEQLRTTVRLTGVVTVADIDGIDERACDDLLEAFRSFNRPASG